MTSLSPICSFSTLCAIRLAWGIISRTAARIEAGSPENLCSVSKSSWTTYPAPVPFRPLRTYSTPAFANGPSCCTITSKGRSEGELKRANGLTNHTVSVSVCSTPRPSATSLDTMYLRATKRMVRKLSASHSPTIPGGFHDVHTQAPSGTTPYTASQTKEDVACTRVDCTPCARSCSRVPTASVSPPSLVVSSTNSRSTAQPSSARHTAGFCTSPPAKCGRGRELAPPVSSSTPSAQNWSILTTRAERGVGAEPLLQLTSVTHKLKTWDL
mmetsp:Transcript_23328/g.59182  ORF Transcript_23328/g.59182 Transcript_23328/m.59182 type:complete len:270 (+) Transcript_23328:1377-2186(+)